MRRALVPLLVAAAVCLGACGGDDGGNATTTAAVDAPPQEDQVVGAGISSMIATMDELASAPESVTAARTDSLDAAWASIEARISGNDASGHAAMQSAFDAFRQAAAAADGEGMRAAMQQFAAAAEGYLSAYPA